MSPKNKESIFITFLKIYGAICPQRIKNLLSLPLVPLLSDSFFEVSFGKILEIFGGFAPKHIFGKPASLLRRAAGRKIKIWIPPWKILATALECAREEIKSKLLTISRELENSPQNEICTYEKWPLPVFSYHEVINPVSTSRPKFITHEVFIVSLLINPMGSEGCTPRSCLFLLLWLELCQKNVQQVKGLTEV